MPHQSAQAPAAATFRFTDLLVSLGIDPEKTLMMRHRPTEPRLAKALGWLAHEHPDAFNAYQATQKQTQENQLRKADALAAFIADAAGKAIFVGLYEVSGSEIKTPAQHMSEPGVARLIGLGMAPPRHDREWFNLLLSPTLAEYAGRLVIEWSGGQHGSRSWSRWATSKVSDGFKVSALHAESTFADARRMPGWRDLVFTWGELQAIPASWAARLSQWRGVYYIHDMKDGKGYVGSACGADNIFGRWKGYALSGHGGNKLLKDRDPSSFRFSILQRTSPDMSPADVVDLESSWKYRLHTKDTGLNSN